MVKRVKKNEISFTKRRKFSNLKRPIISEYCPTCFFGNVEKFLYTTLVIGILNGERLKKI